ncbi:MAG: hypothetical protein AAF713_18190 [Pseudomonadota bacterium]
MTSPHLAFKPRLEALGTVLPLSTSVGSGTIGEAVEVGLTGGALLPEAPACILAMLGGAFLNPRHAQWLYAPKP